MATHAVDLFNSTILPLDGNCFFAPYAAENSGTTQDPVVLHMITSVVSMVKGNIRIPDIYVGTPVVEVMWTSETTANNVDFKFRHRTVGAAELLDIATSPTELETVLENQQDPGTASHAVIDTLALATTDLTAGQFMYYEFERDGISDTKLDTITIWSLKLLFDDA